MCLIDTILDISAQIFKTVSESLNLAVMNGRVTESQRDSPFENLVDRKEFKTLTGDLQHIAIVNDLMNSQIFKSRLVSLDFILTVSKLL